MPDQDKPIFTSAEIFLNSLFTQELTNPDKYDLEVVSLIKQYLCQNPIPSRAGNNLAKALIDLARTRSRGYS